MTDDEAHKLTGMLLAAFAAQVTRLSEEQARALAKVYRRMLVDLDAKTALAAVERLIRTSRYMPTVAEIRASCVTTLEGPVRAGGEAWGDIAKAISKYGMNRSPVFDDKLTAAAVERLGWWTLCNSENPVADRSQFVALYDSMARRHREVTAAARNLAPTSRQLEPPCEGQSEAGSLVAGLALHLRGVS